jgi:signal transduction histidine kinase
VSIFAAARQKMIRFFPANHLGAAFAGLPQMSSLKNIYMKMSPELELAHLHQPHLHQPHSNHETQKLIGREVAHELNNILTIIKGYSDRMMMKHGGNPVLRPELQLISESVKRAETVIRGAARLNPQPASHAAAAAQLAA